MTAITVGQASMFASLAGFSGNGLATILAIAKCESGLDPARIGILDPNDRGILQINRRWHPEVSDSCAFDAACAFREGYRISANGTNFSQWTTYQNGCYKQYLNLMATNTPTATSIPLWTKPFMNTDVATIELNWHHYPKDWASAEGGVDWNPVPLDAPITALLPGVVVGSGYFCKPVYFCGTDYHNCTGAQGYGVVTIRSANPFPNLVSGSQVDIYYQHIIIDPSIGLTCAGAKGQQIQAGQVIGKGNNNYNIEVGLNVGTEWGQIWGGTSPGPHIDPIPFLKAVIAQAPTGGVISGVGGMAGLPFIGGFIGNYHSISASAHEILNNVPGFLRIVEALDVVEQFQPFQLPNQSSVPSSANSVVSGAVQGVAGTLLGPLGPVLLSPLDPAIADAKSQFSKLITPITLPADSIQAILVFLVTNLGAALFRGFLMLIGTIIIIALVINMINPSEELDKAMPLLAAAL